MDKIKLPKNVREALQFNIAIGSLKANDLQISDLLLISNWKSLKI